MTTPSTPNTPARATLRVDLVGLTETIDTAIDAAVGRPFERDPNASDAEHLIETGGRLCYLSFHRPNPATRATGDYIAHILDVREHPEKARELGQVAS